MATSTEILTFYVDTPGVRKLVESCGRRLGELSQFQKYQLVSLISSYLALMTDEDENEEDWSLINHGQECFPEISNTVFTVLDILQNDNCRTLAKLLPAIAEYARDDK